VKILVQYDKDTQRKVRDCYPAGSVIATPEAIRAAAP